MHITYKGRSRTHTLDIPGIIRQNYFAQKEAYEAHQSINELLYDKIKKAIKGMIRHSENHGKYTVFWWIKQELYLWNKKNFEGFPVGYIDVRFDLADYFEDGCFYWVKCYELSEWEVARFNRIHKHFYFTTGNPFSIKNIYDFQHKKLNPPS